MAIYYINKLHFLKVTDGLIKCLFAEFQMIKDNFIKLLNLYYENNLIIWRIQYRCLVAELIGDASNIFMFISWLSHVTP